jgi:hypothetical protein
MLEQVQDTFRKATESTLQFQKEMFRCWTQVPSIPTVDTGWTDQIQAFQKTLAQTITDSLNKHRETFDAQYRAGVSTLQNAFRVGEAKDPEQFRKLIEELWRQGVTCLKTVTEAQIREYQAVVAKGFEVATQGLAAPKAGAA